MTIRGVRIELGEVKAALTELDDVGHAAVVAAAAPRYAWETHLRCQLGWSPGVQPLITHERSLRFSR